MAGQVYLSFVPDGREQNIQVEAGVPFDFYLIVDLDLASGDPYRMRAIEGNLTFSTEIFLSRIEWTGGMWVTAGQGLTEGSYDFLTAVSECLELADGPNVICSFRGLLLEEASNLFVGVGPSVVSSFNGIGPGWVPCDDVVGYLFEPDGPPRALSINSPTAVENSSWARVKTLYRD